ncbi:MAG: hypothetical protein LJE75_10435 [Gammaproteobacteria bacterium]|jgi:hypothetical protein|nr:hypothetical protein [Gammaproteobacteria bacterium]
MRLLEFGMDEGGANPVPSHPRSLPETAKPFKVPESAAAPSSPNPTKGKAALNRAAHTKKATVYPLKSATTPKNHSKPIDLEQLQQRIAVLEQRIKARADALGNEVTARDLEILKKRMKLLEHNIENELWAARQREYNMLQMMAKPTLKSAIKQGCTKFTLKTLPKMLQSLRESYGHWWLNSQPGWWHRFAAAWQESLDKARGQNRN